MSLQVIEAKLEAESKAYQQLHKDLTKAIESRQRLDSQQQENEQVNKEFEQLDDEANIYKLIGPVLVKQDRSEAKGNVKNRLELIGSEIKRVETQIKEISEKVDGKKTEIAQLQMQYQQLRTQAA
ncbi:Prefoldin [Gongronella butleri]|nr:Prefoldin [Gongronella butleri]